MSLILISTALQAGSHLIPSENAVTLNKRDALKEEQCCAKICCTALGHSCEIFFHNCEVFVKSTKTTKLSYWY